MKNIDAQVGEIFRKWTYGDGYIHVPDCIKDIADLIKSEREEAHKEGVSKVMELYSNAALSNHEGTWQDIEDDFGGSVEEYLSQTKGGKTE